jgi:uracil-DNA glycosylase
MNELLGPLGLSVEVCGFTELSKCYAFDRKELSTCSKKCWPIFLNQIREKEYELLVILGVGTAKIFGGITGLSLPMGELACVTIEEKNYAILPIYHPSPINPHGRARNKDIVGKHAKELTRLLA